MFINRWPIDVFRDVFENHFCAPVAIVFVTPRLIKLVEIRWLNVIFPQAANAIHSFFQHEGALAASFRGKPTLREGISVVCLENGPS